MLDITKKIGIAIFVLCVVPFNAHGTWPNNSDHDKVPQRTAFTVVKTGIPFQDGLPEDLMKKVFIRWSKLGVDPRVLERVCKHWYRSIRYSTPVTPIRLNQASDLLESFSRGQDYSSPLGFLSLLVSLSQLAEAPPLEASDAPYITKKNDRYMEDCIKSYMGPEDCIRVYMERMVSRSTLYLNKEPGINYKGKFAIHFSDSQDGAANLSDFQDEDVHTAFTLSESRFLEVRGANKGRAVTYAAPFHKARHLLPADTKGTISDIVVLWRWGNDEKVLIDHCIITPDQQGPFNMKELWRMSGSKLELEGERDLMFDYCFGQLINFSIIF